MFRFRCSRRILMLLLLLLLPAVGAVTAWADLFDSCDDLNGPGRYRNFVPPQEDYIGWASPPDDSYLCQSSNRQQATAVYHCPGAEEAIVAIYSRHGCWADRQGDTLVRGGEDLPLRYRPGSDEVYCDGRRMVYDIELTDFVFLDEEERPSGLVQYGLSAAISSDGEEYQSVSCVLLSAEREGSDAYFYERYRVEMGEDCSYLRLTLTDQSSIQILGREERYRFETVGGLSLASVEIIGEEPAPPSSEPPAPPTSSEVGPLPGSGSVGGESLPTAPQSPVSGENPAALPTLPPEEGENPHRGSWGPSDPEQGPAFPEEPELLPQEKTAGGTSRSAGAAKSSAGKGTSKGSSSRPAGSGTEEPTEDDGMISVRRPLQETASRKVPNWQRALDPQMATTLCISAALLAVGLRLLWRE